MEAWFDEVVKWVEFAKGGPGSGAQPGHPFYGNGREGRMNAADHREAANNHLRTARAAENLRQSVLSPENLHRDGEATPAQVARGRALGAALNKEYAAHVVAASAHHVAAEQSDRLEEAAGMAGPPDSTPAQQAEYHAASGDYAMAAGNAAHATQEALKASAEAGK